jgi:hypothetical protein
MGAAQAWSLAGIQRYCELVDHTLRHARIDLSHQLYESRQRVVKPAESRPR